MSIMEIRNIRYSYDDKRNVLKNVNAELEAGKMYAILGSSGCGKTTLLSLLGGLDSPICTNLIKILAFVTCPFFVFQQKNPQNTQERHPQKEG